MHHLSRNRGPRAWTDYPNTPQCLYRAEEYTKTGTGTAQNPWTITFWDHQSSRSPVSTHTSSSGSIEACTPDHPKTLQPAQIQPRPLQISEGKNIFPRTVIYVTISFNNGKKNGKISAYKNVGRTARDFQTFWTSKCDYLTIWWSYKNIKAVIDLLILYNKTHAIIKCFLQN